MNKTVMPVREVVTMVTSVPSAPVTVAVQVNGSGYASDIFRDLVASFNELQGGNITVISRKCLLEPSEPDYITCFILGKSMTSLLLPEQGILPPAVLRDQ